MSEGLRSAFSTRATAPAAAEELLRQFEGLEPRAVVFFASPRLDGAVIGRTVRGRYPGAAVIGCTSAGEFTNEGSLQGGVSALALGSHKVRRAVATLARFDEGT